MGLADRKKLIQAIEKKRGSKVITLVTSDRYASNPIQGIQASIAPDQVHQIIRHLRAISKESNCEKIDLFLHSRGGDTSTAWPLVNAIRNYCKSFSVLVPVIAYSAATLVSLGADEIVMCGIASLSPIDPTVANLFNPTDENTKQPLGISVEDVTSFVSLAQDNPIGIKKEANVTEVFKILAKKVHPLALGNVKRSHSQIRLLARKLLSLHLKGEGQKSIDIIVDELTERLYTHSHSISRNEARESIGLDNIVKDATPEEETLLIDLYQEYETEMKLKEFFDLNAFLGDEDEKILETCPVMIESASFSSQFKVRQKIKKALIPDPHFRLQVLLNMETNKRQGETIKTGVLQMQTQFAELRASLVSLQMKNPSIQPLSTLVDQCNDTYNSITTLANGLPGHIDLKDLKTSVESQTEFLGWIDA